MDILNSFRMKQFTLTTIKCNSKKQLIDEYSGIISDIQKEIKKLENDTRVLNKLYVILDVLQALSYLVLMTSFC